MSKSEKVAITLPANAFRALERVRKRLRLNRSEAIQQAVANWLSAQEGEPRIDEYIRGYRAQPDDDREAMAFARAWGQGLEAEDWS